ARTAAANWSACCMRPPSPSRAEAGTPTATATRSPAAPARTKAAIASPPRRRAKAKTTPARSRPKVPAHPPGIPLPAQAFRHPPRPRLPHQPPQLPQTRATNKSRQVLGQRSRRSHPPRTLSLEPRTYFFFGTFLPSLRASERPIAMACLRLVTFLPLRPLLSFPCLNSCISRFTSLPADLLYLRPL